jgi:hypothetical protein
MSGWTEETEMKLAWIIALGGGTLVAAACGGTSTLGSGDKPLENGGTSGSGTGGSVGKAGDAGSGGQSGSGGSSGAAGSSGSGGYDPCAGASCGAPCSPCDPKDLNCASDAVIHYCGATGACTPAYPDCGAPGMCGSDKDCVVAVAPCQPCPDGSYACPSVHCIQGQCVGSFQGCGGVKCGADGDCPQLGAPCQKCPDGSVSCPESKCVNGSCVSGFPGCSGYQPCAGKTCGASCSQCDPKDPGCSEIAVLKYCDEAGTCSPNVPKCGGGGQCTTKADCGLAIDLCKYCPGSPGCAQMDCVNGSCEFVCPPNPTPQCKTTLDCPVREVCKPCPGGGCAGTECLNGSCQLVCGL